MFSCTSNCTPLHLTADISKMYRAVKLALTNRHLHCFMWRLNSTEPLQDYCITQITFGVPASSFATNMAVRQNAIDHAHEYPLAARIVEKSFYVDNCLSGTGSPELAILLQQQLSDLFACGGFLLRKWNSNNHSVL